MTTSNAVGELIAAREPEPCGQHAGDRVRLSIQDDRLPDHARIGVEAGSPQRVGDRSDVRRALRIVARGQRPADCRLDAKHVEERAARVHDRDGDGIARARQIHGAEPELRERLERRGVRAPVLEVPLVHLEGGGAVEDLAPDLANRDQPSGFVERQRPEQRRIDDGKHGGRRADGQGERQDDGGGVGAIAPDAAEGITKVEE